jgi:hypothetical protein
MQVEADEKNENDAKPEQHIYNLLLSFHVDFVLFVVFLGARADETFLKKKC